MFGSFDFVILSFEIVNVTWEKFCNNNITCQRKTFYEHRSKQIFHVSLKDSDSDQRLGTGFAQIIFCTH